MDPKLSHNFQVLFFERTCREAEFLSFEAEADDPLTFDKSPFLPCWFLLFPEADLEDFPWLL